MTHQCPTCDDEFETQRGVSNHHAAAHGESIAVKEAECEVCGDTFEYYPSDRKGVVCSQNECFKEYWSENAPAKDEEVHEKMVSNHEFSEDGLDKLSQAAAENNPMERAENRDKISGEGNGRWVEGSTSEYGPGWEEAKEKVLERDEYQCQNCGKTMDELGQKPDVHHIKPFRTFDEPTEAHDLDNLIALCRSCHRNAEEGNIKV